MIRLAILGSTGSIGRQALDVVRQHPGRFRVVALGAGRNVDLLARQVAEFRPAAAWAEASPAADAWRATGAAAPAPPAWQPLAEMARRDDVDVVLVATGGGAGLRPTLAALEAGKVVALANKEALVVGGPVVRRALERGGGELRPVDSEHSAIWQCLWGEDPAHVQTLTLTASGGAFRDLPLADLERVTPAEALRHPNWEMGEKVTIDSATLFNKGLEALEARWLFDVPLARIEVLQHRESIIHSLVTFSDGSIKAQLGAPDMRLPIQCALTYPERLAPAPVAPVRLAEHGALHFGTIDGARFPALQLALEAGRREDTAAAALSGADEAAVDAFLGGRVRFTEIAELLERALEAHRGQPEPDLDALLAAEAWGRRFVAEAVAARAGAPTGERAAPR